MNGRQIFPRGRDQRGPQTIFLVAIWPLATFRGLRAIGPVRTRI